MYFCRKTDFEECQALKQKYNFTNYSNTPLTPYFVISNTENEIELFIFRLPTLGLSGISVLAIDDHLCTIVFQEDFYDKLASDNKRQTWIITYIVICGDLRNTQTIFGEKQNNELTNTILEAFKAFKLLENHNVITRLSEHFFIEYKRGTEHGISLR